jgi:hypothetical protein
MSLKHKDVFVQNVIVHWTGSWEESIPDIDMTLDVSNLQLRSGDIKNKNRAQIRKKMIDVATLLMDDGYDDPSFVYFDDECGICGTPIDGTPNCPNPLCDDFKLRNYETIFKRWAAQIPHHQHTEIACPRCNGTGKIEWDMDYLCSPYTEHGTDPCAYCGGTGRIAFK